MKRDYTLTPLSYPVTVTLVCKVICSNEETTILDSFQSAASIISQSSSSRKIILQQRLQGFLVIILHHFTRIFILLGQPEELSERSSGCRGTVEVCAASNNHQYYSYYFIEGSQRWSQQDGDWQNRCHNKYCNLVLQILYWFPQTPIFVPRHIVNRISNH